MGSLLRGSILKVLFFSQDGDLVEQLGLALRLRWPDLRPLVASEGLVGLEVIEREEPDIVILCEDLPDMSVWTSIKEIRRFSDLPIIVALETDGEMGRSEKRRISLIDVQTLISGRSSHKMTMSGSSRSMTSRPTRPSEATRGRRSGHLSRSARPSCTVL